MTGPDDYAESLLVHYRRIESLKKEAVHYASLDLNLRQLCDLELLLNRAYFPLRGYLSQKDYEAVIRNMRLANGTLWPMPVCLDVRQSLASTLKAGDRLTLRDQEGFMLAVLTVGDVWKPDRSAEARAVFGTDNPGSHPGVRRFLDETAEWYVGGTLEGVHLPIHYDFREQRLSPTAAHQHFSQNGWRNVLGVHTEAYLHRRHREMIMHAARKAGANVFLQPSVRMRHPGDIDYFTRVSCYRELATKFPRNVLCLGIIPYTSRLAGPREALFQALIRKNYGCSHFAVASHHADPFEAMEGGSSFYPSGEARELVQRHEGETGIHMVPLEDMDYVEEQAEYLPASEITAEMTVRRLSETELIRRLHGGLDIPEWFTYPEIVSEMRRAFPPRSKQGFTIFMTGLSGSGKSTLAKVLMVKFMELRDRPVTLLDGDIVRKNLSSELNFSKEHRDLNIIRIGFVASEITKNGGIAICAPIAPYEEPRRINRELIGRYGGYIEVYVSTPIDVCEQRDRKGLYAKARAGRVQGVTGVSDPYEIPARPEITIDTSQLNPEEAAQQVMLYLAKEGYIA